jgi:benzylsuccinate CoA-transferase BbsF subunit
MSQLPLSGIRVADFTWIGAGSFTTKLLADFGADVIKIESSERLDSLRLSRPFKDGKRGVNRSGYFADRNSSKRGVTLDLKHPTGQELARRLIATSDVVANNFTPGTMEKLGLGYDAVREIKPDIVYLAMSMQGAAGPEHKYLGYGLTIGALTGLQYLSGLPDREPAGTGTNYPDHIPNPCHAAFATLAALRHRRRTGQGQLIDVAQTEPTIALLGPAVLQYTANGVVAQREGNERPAMFPHGVFPCAGEDRWIAIAVSTDAAWNSLVQVLGSPSALIAPGLSTHAGRLSSRSQVEAAIEAATRKRDADQLMVALQRAGVAAGVVRTAADIMLSDPQLEHRGHWVRLDHAEMGCTVYNAPPFRMTEVSPTPLSPAPLLGQHTREVCRTILQLDDQQIAQLAAEGVLR